MTAKVNGNTATASVNGENITLKLDGNRQLKITVKEITAITDVLLAARKQALKGQRAKNAAAKAERDAKTAAKLRERLAKLEAGATAAAA